MCSVWISEQSAIISLYSINLLVFKTEAECLLRGTNWVFKSDRYSFVLKGLKRIWTAKGVDFVGDKMLCVSPRDRWCDIMLNVPGDDESDDSKDGFCK